MFPNYVEQYLRSRWQNHVLFHHWCNPRLLKVFFLEYYIFVLPIFLMNPNFLEDFGYFFCSIPFGRNEWISLLNNPYLNEYQQLTQTSVVHYLNYQNLLVIQIDRYYWYNYYLMLQLALIAINQLSIVLNWFFPIRFSRRLPVSKYIKLNYSRLDYKLLVRVLLFDARGDHCK